MSDEVTATFIFTDLVDSTALASRVGPDAAEQIRTAHFGSLRGAIASLGGTEVKNLGDGLMVMFTSARRAVSCAVAMQQAIEVHNRRADEKLSIRVGIAVGEATLEDDDYFGTPVIEAARLCAQCDADQILVTATVLALVGAGLTQRTRSLGGLELKGLPDPVETVEILWEPEAADSETVVLPSRVTAVLDGATLGFFGRTDELAIIAEVAKTARAGALPHLVAIAGEPGMGKTTLAARAAHDLAADSGAIVAFGGCAEGLAAPFQPWIEVVRGLVAAWNAETIDAHLASRGHTLGSWVPELSAGATPVVSVDVASDQLVLFAAVGDVLARAAGDGDLVVILDDLQWSDTASIQLLRYLLTRPTDNSLLFVATYRDSDLTSGDPLTGFLADMRRETNVTRIDLDGFSDTEVVDVMEAAAGHELTEAGVALAHALRRETRGNPFFTGAMLHHLVDNGLASQSAEGRMELTGSLDELGLPASVREVVAHRVERLGDDTVTVLNAAAMIGLRFDFDLLVDLVDLSEDAVLDVLEEATAAALVTEDRDRPGQFSFVHGLVRDALYSDISATRRQRTHRRIAEALEARPDLADATLLATHYIAATRPHDATKAIDYATRAGDDALAAFAPADAVRWYRQALELHLNDDADEAVRCDLQTKLGQAMRDAGDPAHRDLLLATAELADRLDDPNRSIATALALTEYGEHFKPEDPERRVVVARALSLTDDADIATRVSLLVALAIETDQKQFTKRRSLADHAIELARTTDDDRLVLRAMSTMIVTHGGPDDIDRCLTDSDWMVDTAQRIGDRALEVRACVSRIYALASIGRTAERAAIVAHAQSLIEDGGTLQQQQLLQHAAFSLACYRGDHDEAERLATQGYEKAAAAGLDNALFTYAAQLFAVRELQGRLDDLAELFVDVATGDSATPTAYAAAAYLLCQLGRVDEARATLPITIDFLETIAEDMAWTTGMYCAAYAISRTQQSDIAAWLYDRILPYGRLFANIYWTVSTSLHHGLGLLARTLGRTDDALRHFGDAVDANRSAGALYWEAESRIELAETLRARGGPGDDTEATELLADAAACASTFGFAGLTRRIDALRSSER